MADPEHLALIKQGVEAWNEARPQHPDLTGAHLARANLANANLINADFGGADLIGADFTGAILTEANLAEANLTRANLTDANLTRANLGVADLTRADLIGADLTGADLSGAELTGADLVEADLTRADLIGADLTGADLTGADLTGADLIGANLTRADLTGATLTKADLSRADLTRADLTDADLTAANLAITRFIAARLTGADLTAARSFATVWSNLDLRDVEGLENVNHLAPSTVGVDTLYQSEGQIPPEFLRGCGLPQYFVGMVPGLTATASIQHASAFISYSHADADFASRLYDHLFHTRKIPIWLDEHEVKAGDLIMREVDRAIRRSDRVILLCSQRSLTSWWVEEEIERWTAKERESRQQGDEQASMVIPVDLDGYVHSCDHDYARTILEAPVLDAQGWDTHRDKLAKVHAGVERALRQGRGVTGRVLTEGRGE